MKKQLRHYLEKLALQIEEKVCRCSAFPVLRLYLCPRDLRLWTINTSFKTQDKLYKQKTTHSTTDVNPHSQTRDSVDLLS